MHSPAAPAPRIPTRGGPERPSRSGDGCVLRPCCVVVLTATIVVASVFWASTLYADALGRGRGRDIEQQLERLPSVEVYSAAPLGLVTPVDPEPVDDGGRYVVRYGGLRLLLKSGGSFFLLPDGWRSGDGPVIVLRDDSDVRLEFTAGGG